MQKTKKVGIFSRPSHKTGLLILHLPIHKPKKIINDFSDNVFIHNNNSLFKILKLVVQNEHFIADRLLLPILRSKLSI